MKCKEVTKEKKPRKKKERLPVTPKGKIVAALRQLWLRSRERAEAMKQQKYTCKNCGVKQSTAKGKEVKVCVHHKHGIDWDGIAELIRERILQTPEQLEVLCIECHKLHHSLEGVE